MKTRAPSGLVDLSPLHRPLWWAALAVLLFNDNVLKGSGLVPGWLTGKLSDFAFLIVAPVLLAALLPRALPRGLALGAVVLVYAAADLSPVVSDAIVAAAHRFGLPWRLWPDLTDLMALMVLPLTWRLMRPATASTAAPGSAAAPARLPHARPLLESAGVFAGALACLATSAPDVYQRAPYVVNQTAQPREITATWLLRAAPCDGDLAAFAASLTPSDLDDPHGATLGSGEVALLDQPPPPDQPLRTGCPSKSPDRYTYGAGTSCTAVLVQAGSELSALVVYPLNWGESNGAFITCFGEDPESQCKQRYSLKEDTGPDSIALRERGGKLVLSVGTGSRLQVAVLSPAAVAARAPDPLGCRPLLAQQTALPGANGTCSTNSDCRRVLALPVPGRPCWLYGNTSLTAAAVTELRTRWIQRSCVVDSRHTEYQCPPPQPAACLNGRCQEACPGVELPACPSACGGEATPGAACYYDHRCARPDGQWCTCAVANSTGSAKYTCAPPPPVAGCPVNCAPSINSSPPPVPTADAGTFDTRPADTRPADTNAEAGADTSADTSDTGL